MLGLTDMERCWRWVATGKHPSMRDYINIGQTFPLAVSFSQWIDKGFRRMPPRNFGHSPCSWRFWARGVSPQEITCGLMRDSCDSFGRPYPLMMMGNGTLDEWQNCWELVPNACESAWTQMDKISVQRFAEVESLERTVNRLPLPLSDWLAYSPRDDENRGDGEPAMSDELECFQRQLKNLSEKDAGYVALDPDSGLDCFGDVQLVGRILRECNGGVPSTVFLGGTAELTWFAFFRRPLSAADFNTLWADLPQRKRAGMETT